MEEDSKIVKHAVASIQHKFKILDPLSDRCCIYRVPELIRRVNEEEYLPVVVSIGPFHYNPSDPKLKAMQDEKTRYLQHFITRNQDYGLEWYVNFVKSQEMSVRECYAETIELPSQTFIEMVLMDAAFIIEVFYMHSFTDFPINDRVFCKPWRMIELRRDMMLMENQLPFFIVNDLFEKAFGGSNPVNPINRNQTFNFVGLTNYFLTRCVDCPPRISTSSDEIEHLVDFCRIYYLPSQLRERGYTSDENKTLFYRTATHLSERGVKFRAVTVTEETRQLDIKFDNGILEIPTIKVEDEFQTLFRNIVVFEQCHLFHSHVIDYLAFLDRLIDTPKDVEILVHNHIIDNFLGSSDEVATLFNDIFKQINLDDKQFYYSNICKQLDTYAGIPCNKHMADMKSKYFSHPWAPISVLYALIILALTALQVITGFISLK